MSSLYFIHTVQKNSPPPESLQWWLSWFKYITFFLLQLIYIYPVNIKNPPANTGRHKRRGFDPWVGKITWRLSWQPTPIFLSGESHGQTNLVGYHPQDRKESENWSDLSHTQTLFTLNAVNIPLIFRVLCILCLFS